METGDQPVLPIPLDDREVIDRFRDSLGEEDLTILDGLLGKVNQHRGAIKYFDHPLPYQVYLLSVLLEQRKELVGLRRRVEELRGGGGYADVAAGVCD